MEVHANVDKQMPQSELALVLDINIWGSSARLYFSFLLLLFPPRLLSLLASILVPFLFFSPAFFLPSFPFFLVSVMLTSPSPIPVQQPHEHLPHAHPSVRPRTI
ncbi:hypothetical protein C8R45DRAFT_989193 [Mycena sanguinolenta]|nr:hypothetical protein C8R45DRAFT_989193 [Mycena sanguinolenta]